MRYIGCNFYSSKAYDDVLEIKVDRDTGGGGSICCSVPLPVYVKITSLKIFII